MDIKEVRSLLALAETTNITRTAERLNLSPSAIFKQLRLLEEELGVKLYEKTGRTLRITQAAEVLLPHLRGLLTQHEAALGALEEWKGLRSGTLRIGTGPTFCNYVLPALLETYRRQFPAIEPFIEAGHSAPILDSLRKGLLDVAFLLAAGMHDSPDLHVEASWEFEIALVTGSPRKPRRCHLRDLAAEPFILYKPGAVFERLIDGYFAEHKFEPRVVMRFDNAEGIKTMLRMGRGLTMLPQWMVEAEVERKQFSLVRLHEPPLTTRLAMITRKSSFRPAPVSSFIEMARAWCWGKPTRQVVCSSTAV
jgi:DNA-binding transcriptional LysR family regulator